MPSVCFTIDGGEPCGTLNEMGCEDFTSAQEVMDALKAESYGRGLAYALDNWHLLDNLMVTVTFTPDIPEELQLDPSERDVDGRVTKAPDTEKIHALMGWIRANETTATWNGE